MAQTTKSYVSAISLLDTNVILNKVIDIQNTPGLTDLNGALGRYTPVEQTVFHNYVNKPLWVVGVSQGTVTGSGSATISSITLTAGTSGYARKGDMVRFTDGTVGFVSGLTAGANDVIAVTSVDGTNINHTTGQSIYFFSNAVGESSTSRDSQKRDLTKYNQLVQIFGETNEESDLVKMTPTVLDFGNGNSSFAVKDLIEKYLKFKAEVNAAVIQSKISASVFTSTSGALADPVGGGTMQFQRGMDQYISSYGVSDQVDVLDTFDADDLGQFIDLMIAKKAELDFLVCGANPVMRKWDDYFKGVNSSGVYSAGLNVSGKEISFSVEKITYGNGTFQKMNMPIFDQPEIIAPDIKKNAYFLPTGKVKALDKDGKSFVGERFRMRYMKTPLEGGINQGNDIWSEWHSGAAAMVTPSGEKLNWVTNWRTYQALEMLGAQHAGKLKIIT